MQDVGAGLVEGSYVVIYPANEQKAISELLLGGIIAGVLVRNQVNSGGSSSQVCK